MMQKFTLIGIAAALSGCSIHPQRVARIPASLAEQRLLLDALSISANRDIPFELDSFDVGPAKLVPIIDGKIVLQDQRYGGAGDFVDTLERKHGSLCFFVLRYAETDFRRISTGEVSYAPLKIISGQTLKIKLSASTIGATKAVDGPQTILWDFSDAEFCLRRVSYGDLSIPLSYLNSTPSETTLIQLECRGTNVTLETVRRHLGSAFTL